MAIEITDLYIYPIKSCRGIAVKKLVITPFGPAFDRELMLCDLSGRFITQRTFPLMSQIGVRILADTKFEAYLSADSVVIDTEKFRYAEDLREALIWKDTVNVTIAPDNVNEWFSSILNTPCKLVRRASEDARQRKKVDRIRPFHVAFPDGAPILLCSETSLRDLNGRIQAPDLPMLRFRPNIVISGAQPYDEDHWHSLKVGSVTFDHVSPSTRCVITTIDPDTSKKSAEPLATLAKYRRLESGICFGVNLINSTSGDVKLGDAIECIRAT